MTEAADRYTVPALERGLQLLGSFDRHTPTLTPPELARRLGLPRSTVFRLLNTLEALGYVERVDGGRAVRLGLAVLRLGFEYLASLELTQLGTPLLRRLCEGTGFPCNLVVRDRRSIVYVAKIAPPSPFSGAVTVGTRLPAHATVLGHVLLGDLDFEALRALYPEDHLEAHTDRTPADVASLHRMVQAVRAHGHVVGEGFFEPRISTVAAPVRDAAGLTVAAIGITIPSDRLELASIPPLVAQVCETAQALSRLLDHAPPPHTRARTPHPNAARNRPQGQAWDDTDIAAEAAHDEARDPSPATAG
jgi:DNA-binding IclR family transcriptional regulator